MFSPFAQSNRALSAIEFIATMMAPGQNFQRKGVRRQRTAKTESHRSEIMRASPRKASAMSIS
jgi:hypothetical protein